MDEKTSHQRLHFKGDFETRFYTYCPLRLRDPKSGADTIKQNKLFNWLKIVKRFPMRVLHFRYIIF